MNAPQNTNLTKMLIQHPKYVETVGRVEDAVRRTLAGEQQILPICGPSRVGKTYATLPTQKRFAERREGSTRIMPWMYIKMSQAPSLSSLPREILKIAGLGAWASRRGGPEVLAQSARDAIQRLGVRVLVIDEFHHYAERGAKASALDAANAVKNFVDQTGISCILSGLPSIMSLLNRDEQIEARALAEHHFLPYMWEIDSHRKEFELVLESILDYLVEAGFVIDLKDDFALRTYISSAGRVGMIVKLMNEACDLARHTQRIDLAVMQQAHARAIRHETKGANPFAGSVTNADAMAAFVRLMQNSGYSSEFMAMAIRLEGGSDAIASRFAATQGKAAARRMQEQFAC